MPWFITAIHSKYGSPDTRCFGFFNTYNEAYNAIENNSGDMHEYLYNYIVLEYMETGIHPYVRAVDWWKWVDSEKKWVYISKKDWPEYSNMSNWALG